MKLTPVKTHYLNPHIGKPLKKTPIPKGFILIQDTREQRPLFQIKNPWIISKALKHGDYSIKGFEDDVCFERKQLSDFYSYIGKERHKTISKMDQFSRMSFVGLVIEATEDDILIGYHMSKLSPEHARGALVSFEVRYGVHVYYSRSRDCIRRWILDRATKWYLIQREIG